MPALSIDPPKDKHYPLPLLLIISVVSHFPFVLKGFGELDATKIAVSVIDMLRHGSNAAFSNFYFTDVIPLYILYLKWFVKLLDYNYSYLPVIMNYTNAVFGTLIIIPAFYLIKQLFRNSTIAFCAVLALIFSPSFYQSTIIGFPHLLALFFLLMSLCFYLTGLDNNENGKVYFMMMLSCVSLTVAFLFKSDYVLAAGAYIGFLFIRKIRDKGKIISAILIVVISGVLFLLFRNLILGETGGTTMSKAAMSKWYNFSLSIPKTVDYMIVQTEPIIYGAGIVTFCLGVISLVFFLFKKRLDVLTFVISWAAVPTLFWLIMIGNNARHNMISVFPLLVVVIIFFYEKAPRYVIVLTLILISSNFFVTSPSPSILRPSGNLFKSHALLEDRMTRFRSSAKEIANIDEEKIAVLGYFHNPHVIFEIMRSVPFYEALRIERENYKIITGNKEYVFIYFVATKPEDMEEGVDYILDKYDLNNHLFVSATYDLKTLNSRGIRSKTLDIIERGAL